ncbi:glycine/sarcosine/betaine reductase selenoprotein B family protein [Pseudonocardia sp. Cha107L01]|uniref:glycine/sarcosine/betaine reductase selenoprotein B family protein n=1 Tax=Pseudonocardia sp. Cha107L01 TaxID=3457576 RepID=UPI00403ED604
MPRLDGLPPKMQAVLRAQPVAEYDSSPDAGPVTLASARVALVTSAGLHGRGDEPFVREDPGFRVIPSEVSAQDIVQSHTSIGFDRTAMQRDINVVFPIDRLRELEAEGVIGERAPRFLSFMGAQHDPEPALASSAAGAAEELLRDRVDVVLLTPT